MIANIPNDLIEKTVGPTADMGIDTMTAIVTEVDPAIQTSDRGLFFKSKNMSISRNFLKLKLIKKI